jgi:MFS transporter, OFA family, oxalate/formate antiporter
LVPMRKTPFFYGYTIVAAAFCIMSISWGSNRTFGVFLEPMVSDFGWTRAQISGAFTLGTFIMGIGSVLAGRLTDRMGPRAVLVGCGLFLGCGYIGASQIQTIGQFYFFYGGISGIGMSGAWVPLMSVVTRWFLKRRAFISGIVATGPSMGIVAMPLLFSIFISAWGWRVSYIILGIMVLSVSLVAALFLKRDPAAMGLLPYGAEERAAGEVDVQTLGFSLEEALRTRQFWILGLITFCDLFLINVIVVHLVPHALKMNIPAMQAASILSLGAGVSIPGRIFIGWMADRIGNREGLFICLILSVISIAILLWARELWTFYLFSVIYGVSLWSTGAIMSPLTAGIFGLKNHASIFSFTALSGMIGGGVGPVLVGYTFDVTGNYEAGLFICFFVSGIALSGILLLRPLRQKPNQ